MAQEQAMAREHERVLFCLHVGSSLDENDRKQWREALMRVMRVKLHMNEQHELGVALCDGARGEVQVLQTFTRDLDALDAAVTRALQAPQVGGNTHTLLAALVDQVSAWRGRTREAEHSDDNGRVADEGVDGEFGYRVVVLHRHDDKPMASAPRTTTAQWPEHWVLDFLFTHSESDDRSHVQREFEQVCAYATRHAPRGGYVIDAGGHPERFHQTVTLMLMHPLHRPAQETIEAQLCCPHIRLH